MFKNIDQKSYTYIFSSLKIVFFKKFKIYILNQIFFTDYLYLFFINKIHLIKKQDKNF